MTTPTDNKATVLGVLSANADNGKTAREVSEESGLKYSTVTGLLRDLESTGEARKEKSGRQVTWTRLPDPADTGTDSPSIAANAAVQNAEAGTSFAEAALARRNDTHTSGSDQAVDISGWSEVGLTDDTEPLQTAAETSEADTHTDAPADPGTPATVDLTAAQSAGDVLAAMTAISPVPDAPAPPTRAPRTPRAGAAPREVRNDFGSGGLQGEVLRYMDENKNDDGTYKEYGPYELSIALQAHASSVAYSLKRTTAKGQTVNTTKSGAKPRFRLATSEETAAHLRRVADAKAVAAAVETPAETPAA